MTPNIAIAVAEVTGSANVISAFLVIYLMQGITADAGFKCPMALIKLVQRVFLSALSVALMANGVHIVTTYEVPHSHDIIVEMVFFGCLVISYVRHRKAPPIPQGSSWEYPAFTNH